MQAKSYRDQVKRRFNGFFRGILKLKKLIGLTFQCHVAVTLKCIFILEIFQVFVTRKFN